MDNYLVIGIQYEDMKVGKTQQKWMMLEWLEATVVGGELSTSGDTVRTWRVGIVRRLGHSIRNADIVRDGEFERGWGWGMGHACIFNEHACVLVFKNAWFLRILKVKPCCSLPAVILIMGTLALCNTPMLNIPFNRDLFPNGLLKHTCMGYIHDSLVNAGYISFWIQKVCLSLKILFRCFLFHAAIKIIEMYTFLWIAAILVFNDEQ
jgi:hypothetical protein